MDYFKFYDEYIKRAPSATAEQVQKAWCQSGYAPQDSQKNNFAIQALEAKLDLMNVKLDKLSSSNNSGSIRAINDGFEDDVRSGIVER